MPNKRIIRKNFSNASENYAKFALVQKKAALNICLLAKTFLQNGINILDLGCGSGFVADNIPNYQENNFSIFRLDISHDMLKKHPHLAVQCDIENLCFKAESFDLILSSFSLQWIENFEETFAKIYEILKPNGFFIFAVPNYQSLSELKTASINSGCNFHFNDLPKTAYLKFYLEKSGFNLRNNYQEIIKQEFNSAVDALKSIKNIGANYSLNKNNISKSRLKKFDIFFLNSFTSDNKKPHISWIIDYFVLQK